jgi:hypothetical protein
MVVPMLIGVNGRTTARQVAAGQQPTPPVLVNGLIDSGSDVTCVASRVVQQLRLPMFRRTSTHSIAGSVPVKLYEVSLGILRPPGTGGSLFALDQLVVMELAQPPDAAEVLVGLDVPRQLLVILNGQAGAFTLGD